jgi:hypothetical protein
LIDTVFIGILIYSGLFGFGGGSENKTAETGEKKSLIKSLTSSFMKGAFDGDLGKSVGRTFGDHLDSLAGQKGDGTGFAAKTFGFLGEASDNNPLGLMGQKLINQAVNKAVDGAVDSAVGRKKREISLIKSADECLIFMCSSGDASLAQEGDDREKRADSSSLDQVA